MGKKARQKKFDEEEFYTYDAQGVAWKMKYSSLEESKRNLPFWKKFLVVLLIFLSLAFLVFVGWLSKNFG